MKATGCCAGDRFALFIDLRSMRDNDHGSGLRLVNKKKEFNSQLRAKLQVQGMLDVTSSSSRTLSSTS